MLIYTFKVKTVKVKVTILYKLTFLSVQNYSVELKTKIEKRLHP